MSWEEAFFCSIAPVLSMHLCNVCCLLAYIANAISIFRVHSRTPWNSLWPVETFASLSGRSVWSIMPFSGFLRNLNQSLNLFFFLEVHHLDSGKTCILLSTFVASPFQNHIHNDLGLNVLFSAPLFYIVVCSFIFSIASSQPEQCIEHSREKACIHFVVAVAK